MSGKNIGFSTNMSSHPASLKTIVTIGDYFSAAHHFLLKNDFSILKSGLEAVFNTPVQANQITKIVVFLEKHGSLYHPLKIQVVASEKRTCSFVLNGAVSRSGLSLIENEYDLISKMNQAYSKHYLPQVFGVDFIETDKGRIGFFLGEWFEGYKEFHVTEDQDRRQIVIWESDGSCHYVFETNALEIYQEISRILTYYYDLETFEQISPWHHAAGDFIVKQEKQSVHVRLITVRGYSPLKEFCTGEEDKKVYILPSLLLFFLNLTLRMRLDRLNGTGKTYMLGNRVIKATIKGFLKALDEKSTIYDFGDLRSVFTEFFRQFSPGQITKMMENILESTHPESSEINLLEKNLESHCKILHLIFKNI
ncbi:MAG: hypothetical protein K8S13_01190 [Desulfobacula sp.]|uniref:hypothetical protein n=1 Tax=Desulfobacula sp. TaxID=2593537 RepID=UPI0025BC63E5|nr:hypothetical protein [Desulfobacula sp.]MCD4718463.1 hypothetical protein [Desulfobacula sp.]